MKSHKRSFHFPQNKNARAFAVTMSGLFVFAHAADTQQEIISTPASETPEAPLMLQSRTNEFEVFNAASEDQTIPRSTLRQPFQWGKFIARPHIDYQFVYATGLLSTPGNPQDTFIQSISPGILLELGPHWALDYTPTLRFYSNRSFHNEFDNLATLNGATVYENWTVGVMQNFDQSSSPLVQTGTQTEQETFDTVLTASDQLNEKTSMDLGLYQNLQFTEGFQDSREWSTMDWLNYQFWARFNVGVGAGGGYVNVDSGPDQTFEQLAARANWRATDKISFQANAGFQDWQFLQSGAGNLITPTFGAAIQYQPFKQTRISVNGSRTVSPSYFANENTEITSVGGDFNQRLLGKLFLDLNASYNLTKYVASASGISANREDDYYLLNARLSRQFLKRGTVAVFYQFSSDSSTTPGFSFNSNQVGFEVGFSY